MQGAIEAEVASRSRWTWMVIAALVGGAAASGCGNTYEIPPYSKNCCVDGTRFYICTDPASAGECMSQPPQPSGCIYQPGLQCPDAVGNP